MDLRTASDRARHHLRRPLARMPYLWDAAMWVRPGKRATLARSGTVIVIDGFLRSGNTFSVAAFITANGDRGHVGRHLHGAPHILRAVRMGLPTVLLIRHPLDATLSYLVRRPTLTPDDALMEYLDYYRTAWRARSGFLVALFDDVVTDFGAVTKRVNERFGTTFTPYHATPDNEAAAFGLVERMNRLECGGDLVETHVGRPSPHREVRKSEVRAAMQHPRTVARLEQAEKLYARYVGLAGSAR